MPNVVRREWSVRGPSGRKVKRVSYGFSTMINGELVRRYDQRWTREDAQRALSEALLGVKPYAPRSGVTFGEAVERYLAAKSRRKSVEELRRICAHLTAHLGADTALTDVTAARVSAYKARRMSEESLRTKRPLGAASVNRPLAVLRNLLRTAHAEWELIAKVPAIKLEREPQGKVRWLEPDEESRLMAACDPYLARVVTVALETGMRAGEMRALTWDRVDMSRGVIRLEVTKSGKRREVPMRQRVYDALSGVEPKQGRVFPQGMAQALRARGD